LLLMPLHLMLLLLYRPARGVAQLPPRRRRRQVADPSGCPASHSLRTMAPQTWLPRPGSTISSSTRRLDNHRRPGASRRPSLVPVATAAEVAEEAERRWRQEQPRKKRRRWRGASPGARGEIGQVSVSVRSAKCAESDESE
jgi:hypothetical protein